MHKKVCKIKDFYNVIIPSENIKILEFNPYQKSDQLPFIVSADRDCIKEKIDEYKNNPENPSTAKLRENIPSVFSMSTSHKSIANKNDVYRDKDCMKKFFVNFCGHNDDN